jgi:hypothetical protein
MAGLAQPQHDAQRGSGSSGTAGRLTAPPGARTPSSMPASPLSSASAFGGAPGRGDSSSDQRSGTDSTCFRTVADSGMSSTLVVPTRDAASTDGGRSSNPFALVPSGMSSAGGSGNRRQPLFDTSADVERWSEPLVTVEILGHMWVPDVDGGGKAGGLHLEFMLKTIGDEEAGARMVQRRFKDFDKLHTALVPIARRASVPLPPLPSSLTFGRNLTEEFANQRQIALQQWLSMVRGSHQPATTRCAHTRTRARQAWSDRVLRALLMRPPLCCLLFFDVWAGRCTTPTLVRPAASFPGSGGGATLLFCDALPPFRRHRR